MAKAERATDQLGSVHYYIGRGPHEQNYEATGMIGVHSDGNALYLDKTDVVVRPGPYQACRRCPRILELLKNLDEQAQRVAAFEGVSFIDGGRVLRVLNSAFEEDEMLTEEFDQLQQCVLDASLFDEKCQTSESQGPFEVRNDDVVKRYCGSDETEIPD